MPVNKDAMARYRIIDRMLADTQKAYTTQEIEKAVNQMLPDDQKVTVRMIQKDIKALEEAPFNKVMIRGEGGRGTVRYEDQSTPVFYQEITPEEEDILREALDSLGQFEGLENFKWLENLKKRLAMPSEKKARPLISFSRNDVLQIHDNLLGTLYSAIARRKVIRFGYRRFEDKGQAYTPTTVYPYQLRQYNNRWFLLCNPVGKEDVPFDPEKIFNYPLDRMDGKVEYIEDMPYIDTPVNVEARFAEIIGVTYRGDEMVQDIYFAVHPSSVNYIRTKLIHPSQDEVNPATERDFLKKYPSLKGWSFFVITCRYNVELCAVLSSYADSLVVIEPVPIRDLMAARFHSVSDIYQSLRSADGEDTLR